MTVNIEYIKNAVRQVIREQDEAGISPIIIPPLAKPSTSSIQTNDVVESLLRHKRYARAKKGTLRTYQKHYDRFARRFPYLPLETKDILNT